VLLIPLVAAWRRQIANLRMGAVLVAAGLSGFPAIATMTFSTMALFLDEDVRGLRWPVLGGLPPVRLTPYL
jgi:hypothetical protein